MLTDPITTPALSAVTPPGVKHRSVRLMAIAILFLAAIGLDAPISGWVHAIGLSGWLKMRPDITLALRIPGRPDGAVLALLVAIATAFTRLGLSLSQARALALKNSAIVVMAALLSGINAVIKWGVGRIRPFHGAAPFHLSPFKGGWRGQWLAEQNLSFPSGDASLAFALAMALAMVAPGGRLIWWSLAVMVALERIAEGAHYPSDVMGGALLGIVCAILARRLVERWLGRKPALTAPENPDGKSAHE